MATSWRRSSALLLLVLLGVVLLTHMRHRRRFSTEAQARDGLALQRLAGPATEGTWQELRLLARLKGVELTMTRYELTEEAALDLLGYCQGLPDAD